MRRNNADKAKFCLSLLPLVMAAAAVLGSAAPLKEVQLVGVHQVPARVSFEYNHFLLIERAATRHPGVTDSSVAVLDSDGLEVFSRAPGRDVPNTAKVTLYDAALSPGLALVVSATAWSESSRPAASLFVYDTPSGELLRIIRTQPFVCTRVTIDKQGSLWCLGADVEKYNAEREDYAIVRKYSMEGRQIGEYFPRSLFPPRPASGLPNEPSLWRDTGLPRLVARGDRIWAWLPNTRTLLSWNLHGELLTKQEVPEVDYPERHSYQPAFLPDGRVVWLLPHSFSHPDKRKWKNALYRWDATLQIWVLADSGAPTFLRSTDLVGADGNGLVFWDRSATRLFWISLSAQ